jgi:hypothetical protein
LPPTSATYQAQNAQNNAENAQRIAQKTLVFDNRNYEPNIRTALLYPQQNTVERTLFPPITFIGDTRPLVLEFDELNAQAQTYHIKIYHCNADWTKSVLNDMDFLMEFNEFPIMDYELSFNTRVPYVHYRFEVPRLKASGNYLLVVYRGYNVQDIVLSKRFMVYETQVSVRPEVRSSTNIGSLYQNQQIDFSLAYPQYDIFNPRESVKVVIRQNYRWDQAIYGLQPTSVRETERVLEYKHFDGKNNFPGNNEFRQFDLQSIRFQGFRVAALDLSGTENRARIAFDDNRSGKPYFRQPDMNGGFYIQHAESKQGPTESDYVKVYFTLKSAAPLSGDVYVMGAFNDWRREPENKMRYYPEEEAYQTNILLKQGMYDYMYALWQEQENAAIPLSHTPVEGSYVETQNTYDILVYHRPPGARADRLVGYGRFNTE